MVIFFTIIIVGLTNAFPGAMAGSLSSLGAVGLAPVLSAIPPTGALFSAFLGYNPVTAILGSLPAAIVKAIPASTVTALTTSTWFPQTLSAAFMPSLRISFYFGAMICTFAAILSAMRGQRYIHEIDGKNAEKLVASEVQSNISPGKLYGTVVVADGGLANKTTVQSADKQPIFGLEPADVAIAEETLDELNIRINRDVYEAFRQYCFDTESSKSRVAEQALKAYLGLIGEKKE
jgi:hypothetical protein